MTRTKLIFSMPPVLLLMLVAATLSFAVPETSSVRISDVTPSSFSVVWLTDVPADPSVEVYSDNAMATRLTDGLVITPMPSGNAETVRAAKDNGVMKVRVSGLSPSVTYYVRTVTKDPANSAIISYSPLYSVLTASQVAPYRLVNNALQGYTNDLASFKVYVRPSGADPNFGLGDLIMLEYEGSPYPLSAFVGDCITNPEGLIDLNNLFGLDNVSMPVDGGERVALRVYRGLGLSTLTHYRRLPQTAGSGAVAEPQKGFFADFNLDGNVDEADFLAFKNQYRTSPQDASYNPDFNFVDDPDGKVDIREFSKFSKEYGRTNVR